MTPCALETHRNSDENGGVGVPLIDLASAEIEQMRHAKDGAERCFHSFPPSCLALLKSLEGNHRCIDCGEQNPQWAACRYGALLCLKCSGHHRSLGVQVSSVRSISMDEWSVTEVISMLEGGNSQIANFFERHALTESGCTGTESTTITKENVTRLRYKTKAALFYRRQMEMHVANVLAAGPYQGREISRRLNVESSSDSNVE
jgi:Putative GTPase activating protein for Arf